jgi:rod shape-determining protein MreC
MLFIIQFIVRHKTFFSLGLTVLLSLLMLNAEQGSQRTIARTLTLSVFYPLQFTIQKITDIQNIYAQNRKLREEVTKLSVSVSQMQEQCAENSRLRAMLDFQSDFYYDLLPVRTVAREPSPVYRSLVINAGTSQGLQNYIPIVTETGVVGKIVQVMPHISLVQTLKDPLSRISVMVKRSRIVGIMETATGRDFYIRHHSFADVVKGDTIVTSGLGGIYPRGLTVGYVTEVEEYNDPLFHKILRTHIKLSVDFNHLEEAFAIRLSPQWSALRNELDSLKLTQ